jgi:hypothetical protein
LSLIQYLSKTVGWVLTIGIPITLYIAILTYAISKLYIVCKNKLYATAILFLILIACEFGVTLILILNGIKDNNNFTMLITVVTCAVSSLILFICGK